MGRWWWGRGIKREGKRKSSDGENVNDVDCGGSNLGGKGGRGEKGGGLADIFYERIGIECVGLGWLGGSGSNNQNHTGLVEKADGQNKTNIQIEAFNRLKC